MRRVFGLILVMCFFLGGTAQAQQAIYEAREQGDGSNVTVEGTVTRAYGDFVRLQDDSGPTGASALVVRKTSGGFYDDIQDGTISRGTQLRVSGTLSDFNGLLQINEDDLSSYTVQGEGSVPEPQTVTLSDIRTNGADYESELVRIEDLRFPDASGTFDNQTSYTVSDGRETLTYRVQGTDETNYGGRPIPSDRFTYVGVTGEFQGEYQLLPIRATTTTFRFGRLFAMAQEGDGSVSVNVRASNVDGGAEVSVTAQGADASTADPSTDVSGFTSPKTLTFTGTDSGPKTLTFEPVDDDQEEGVERLEVTLQSNDGVVAAPRTFTLWLLDDATAQGAVAEGQTGNMLIDQLRETYGSPPTLGYDTARDTMFSTVYGARGDSLRGVYTGFAKFLPVDADPTVAACSGEPSSCTDPNDINTEHAWPQSLGAGQEPARSNMHILFPARADVNTARSNNPYAEIPDDEVDQWFVRDQAQTTLPPEATRSKWSERAGDRFEPRHSVKGDVARALFYFLTVYPDRAVRSFYESQRETLLDWHQQDPVDAAEMRRNIRQASFQGNKLNPFVVDPTLVDRAYGSGADAGVPSGLTATAGAESISLSWTAATGAVEGYHVYRATNAFSRPSAATRLTDAPVSATEYTDTAGDLGEQYVYAVTAVEPDGEETALSDRVTATFYPSSVSATISRTFGATTDSEGYRLVALPGQVERGIAQTLDGDAGVSWQAYWDNGQSDDFFVRFEDSEQFQFRPGRGFWLVSETDWQVDLSVETVALSEDGSTTIPLHDGWNIISNPYDIDVSWSAVDEAHDAALQPIWAWDGSYGQSSVFTSARSGQAFYFYNNQGLDALRIPYTPAEATAQSKSGPGTIATIRVRQDSAHSSSVRVGTAKGASDGADSYDYVAPPNRFAPVSLHLTRSDASEGGRQARLRRDIRAPDQGGHVFSLALETTTAAPLTVEAKGLTDLGGDAVLIEEETSQRFDLSGPEVMLSPDTGATHFRLVVGTNSFVERTAAQAAPDRLHLHPPAPNPVTGRATITYDLPEASDVEVAVYDVLGRRVTVLAQGQRQAGTHRTTWRAEGAAPGVYLLRLAADGQTRSRKIVRIR